MSDTKQPEAPQIDVDSLDESELDTLLDQYQDTNTTITNEEEVLDEHEQDEEIKDTNELPDGSDEGDSSDDSDSSGDAVESDDSTDNVEDSSDAINLEGYSVDEISTMEGVYKDLFREGIKASGINRTVRNPEHLKTLVRIGFSANENNRKVKPYLKTIRSFENASIALTPDNINFMVDIMRGDKNALRTLIKDQHRLGEEDIMGWYDTDEAPVYTPNNHIVNDASINLEDNLKDISKSEHYGKVLDILDSEDTVGNQFVAQNPSIVKLLHDDMNTGVYEKAMDETLYRMDKGILPNASVLLNYIEVMKDQDFYTNVLGKATDGGQKSKSAPTKQSRGKDTPTKKPTVSNRKRRATSDSSYSPSVGGRSEGKQKTNVDAMSNEEFEEFYKTLGIDDY